VLTDNKNRAAAEIRAIFTKHDGKLSPTKHLFHRKGQILVAKDAISEDDLMTLVLDAGAEDMKLENDSYEILTEPNHFEAVHKALETKGIKPQSAEISHLPLTPVPVTDEKTAKAVLTLVEALEDNEDVQNVHANFDIPDKLMEKVQTAT
jgi:transcriptional/translational regulatory protein YebC/TACO1